MIIDAHSHILDKRLFDRLGQRKPPSMVDINILLEEQHRSDVDLSVLSGPRVLETAIEAGLDALSAARDYNDFAAELVARHPRRLAALGVVHPMGGDAMLREMERAVRQLGLRGFLVVPRYGEEFLDAPAALPFFEMCQSLDAVAFVHSADSCLACEHMQQHRLVELVGRPNEMTLVAARLILAGHLERFPRLKLLFARLGGAITLYAGRIQQGWETRISRAEHPWGPDNLQNSFMDSLRRIHVDTQTFHPPAIRCAVDTIGAGQVLFGSDFPPVPRSLRESVNDVRHSGVSDADIQKILCDNALRLFRLDQR